VPIFSLKGQRSRSSEVKNFPRPNGAYLAYSRRQLSLISVRRSAMGLDRRPHTCRHKAQWWLIQTFLDVVLDVDRVTGDSEWYVSAQWLLSAAQCRVSLFLFVCVFHRLYFFFLVRVITRLIVVIQFLLYDKRTQSVRPWLHVKFQTLQK